MLYDLPEIKAFRWEFAEEGGELEEALRVHGILDRRAADAFSTFTIKSDLLAILLRFLEVARVAKSLDIGHFKRTSKLEWNDVVSLPIPILGCLLVAAFGTHPSIPEKTSHAGILVDLVSLDASWVPSLAG